MIQDINEIVSFPVADCEVELAKAMRRQRDKRYGNIYEERGTDMRWIGDVGEIVLHRALMSVSMDHTTWFTKDANNFADFDFFGDQIDLKTVKRKGPMKLHYEAQITRKHAEKAYETIIFGSYQFPIQTMHVLGVMSKRRFMETAKLYQAGDNVHKDYKIREGHEILAVRVDQLTPFREYLRYRMNNPLPQAVA